MTTTNSETRPAQEVPREPVRSRVRRTTASVIRMLRREIVADHYALLLAAEY